jgi:hypothetical protein
VPRGTRVTFVGMTRRLRRPRAPRRTVAVAAVAACVVVLTACSDPVEGDAEGEAEAPATSTSSSAASSSAAEPTEGGSELAAGLLTQEDFGPEATLVEVDREQLIAAAPAAGQEDVQISPESCSAAVQGTQPQIEDYDDVAGISATTGAVTTVEVLLRGEATQGAVDQLSQAVENCPEAQISSPAFGEASITFEAVEAPELGDASAAVRYVTTVTQGDTEVSVPTLIGMVQDGDRVVMLLTLASDGSEVDPAEFTGLLEQAYDVQADALG